MSNNVFLYIEESCYGCGVCSVICPKKIIEIKENKYGFYTPTIKDFELCINCGLCIEVCSYCHDNVEKSENSLTESKGYASWSNDEKIRKNASSGGTGFEVAHFLNKKGYMFCGVRYNAEKQIAEHFMTDSLSEYERSMGSKYIPSYTVDAFSTITKGRKYFVTGTPCQIDSLRRYIKKRKIEDHFVLMDFFCHGVPSLLMWHSYLKTYQNGHISDVCWRNKELGWHNSWVVKFFDSGIERYSSNFNDGDLFYDFFLGHRCLNPACQNKCKYKYTNSAADIRIGDLWGTKYQNNEAGVTGVIAFTTQGKNILKQMSDLITIFPESLEYVAEAQMKKNAYPAPSYNYVMESLIQGKNLLHVNRVANVIDFIGYFPGKIKYYFKRVFQKIFGI